MQGGSKMFSIRLDTRIVSPCGDSSYRKSICARLKKYSVFGLYRVGWKCSRFVSIWSKRSRFARDLNRKYSALVLSRVGWKKCRFDRVDTNRFTWCWVVMREVDLRETYKLFFPCTVQSGLKTLRFVSIRMNRHESFPLLSSRYARSRFARDLENTAPLYYAGWVENVSIRLDSMK